MLSMPEQDRKKRENAVLEPIKRKKADQDFVMPPIKSRKIGLYPWEVQKKLSRISKEFFYCKGSSLNPPRKENGQDIEDCKGYFSHGFENTSGGYPILMELLNYVQNKLNKKVIITSGHRCATHEEYVTGKKRKTKHQIGARVNFYVQSYEKEPEEILALIFQYYKKHNLNEYQSFQKQGDRVWKNKEIKIRVLSAEEGRNLDNQHPFPYFDIEVLFDRNKNQKI